jgi:hypothetical protein
VMVPRQATGRRKTTSIDRISTPGNHAQKTKI